MNKLTKTNSIRAITSLIGINTLAGGIDHSYPPQKWVK